MQTLAIFISGFSFVIACYALYRTVVWDTKKRVADAKVDDIRTNIRAPIETAFDALALLMEQLTSLRGAVDQNDLRDKIRDIQTGPMHSTFAKLSQAFARAETHAVSHSILCRAYINNLEEQLRNKLELITDQALPPNAAQDIQQIKNFLHGEMDSVRREYTKLIAEANEPPKFRFGLF